MLPPQTPLKILGLDPGLRTTGWGCIQQTPEGWTLLGAGVVTTSPRLSVAERLGELLNGLLILLHRYTPHEAAVEEVFLNTNAETSLKLAMARGVTLCAPAHLGIPVFSYTANRVKKAVVGYGHADKEQVAWGIRQVLVVEDSLKKDASDSLAVAICHGQSRLRPF
jgi:crossover junction endodeoxyribonuclease RuvC